jgi:hypothetical protein
MASMLIQGEIVVEYSEYDPDAKVRWKRYERDEYPKTRRYRHWDYNKNIIRPQAQRFSETYFGFEKEKEGCTVWVESFKLVSPSPAYQPNVDEIWPLAPANFSRLQKLGLSLPFEFRDPDVLVYHPQSRSLSFYEVKEKDTVTPEQVDSLGLIQFCGSTAESVG